MRRGRSPWRRGAWLAKSEPFGSLPELMDFRPFGKTILVVNKKFRLFLASQLGNLVGYGSKSRNSKLGCLGNWKKHGPKLA